MADAADPRADEIRTLFQLAERANLAERPTDLHEPALEAITRLLRVERAAVLLFDDAGVMRFVAWCGLSDAYRAAVDGHTPWTRDTRDPQAIVVADAHQDAELARYRPVFDAEGIRALGFIPLVHGDRVIGKFMVYDAAPRAFTARELELAGMIAAHVATAVGRNQLLDREREARARATRQADRTRRLERVTARLSRALDLREISDLVLGEGAEALAASSAAIWSLPAGGGGLELIGAVNYDAEARAAVERIPLGSRLPIAGAALRGEPVWLEDRGRACLPLELDGLVRGAVEFSFGDARRFDEEERTFVILLTQACAHAFERARLYEAERAARHEAEEAVAVRDDFLSIAGHELKTPLTALLMQAESLVRIGDGEVPPRVAERLEKVLRVAERMRTLIDELLDVSRITAGRLQLQLEEVDLAAVVVENVARMSDDFSRASSDVQLDISGALCGRWDRSRIEQVVTNLLSNAIKYGAGKPIEVRAEADGERAVLTVRDRGIGIAPEDQARIFDRFERAVSSRHFGGLGLGLWIARQIIEAHGGSIAVDSTPGEGAQFRIALPMGAWE
jgi:signal transduction histidine kinase